jgi:putative ABC transport system permease protein
VLIVGAGINPFLATLIACVAGAVAGLMTAWLNVRLKILHLLASILTMIALYSINLRIMGRPNIALLGETTVFTPLDALGLPTYWVVPAALFVLVLVAKLVMDWFLNSEIGLAMRATGANARMARAQGINTDFYTLLGMAISNALVALAGALFAQSQGQPTLPWAWASSSSAWPPSSAARRSSCHAPSSWPRWPASPARCSTGSPWRWR